MAPYMPAYKTVAEFNDQLKFTKPSRHLIVLGLVLVYLFSFTQSSNQDLNSYDYIGPGFNRYFEQIPLSVFVGYLLFRTFNVVMKEGANQKKSADMTYMLVLLGSSLLAAWFLMREISYYFMDDEDEAKRRRQKITQVLMQSLAFGAIFVLISHKSFSLKRVSSKVGDHRYLVNMFVLSVVLCCMFVNDIQGLKRVLEENKGFDGWQQSARWIKLGVTVVMVIIAMRNEHKIWKQVKGDHNGYQMWGAGRTDGGMQGLDSSDSAAYTGAQGGQTFGYEI